ncbi:hypothetical protein, partial [Pararhodospirillum oryzae]|uniref:hypothetical protein n=1 Tax=Pararhodospirillum oryzae TaxID=478448 RepID=UPI0011BE7CE0
MSAYPGEGWVIPGEDNFQVVGRNEELAFSEDFEWHTLNGTLSGADLCHYPVEWLSSTTMARAQPIMSYRSDVFDNVFFLSDFRVSFFMVIEGGVLPQSAQIGLGSFQNGAAGSTPVYLSISQEGVSLRCWNATTSSPWFTPEALLDPSGLSFISFYITGSTTNGIHARVRTSILQTTDGESEIVHTSDHQLSGVMHPAFENSTFTQLVINAYASSGTVASIDNISVISTIGNEGQTDYNNPLLNRNDFNGDGYA